MSRMNRFKFFYTFFYLIFLMAFTGCTMNIKVAPQKNGDTKIEMNFDYKSLDALLQEATSGINAIAQAAAGDSSGDLEAMQLITEEAMKQSLEEAGFRDVKVKSTGPCRIEASFTGKFENAFADDSSSRFTISSSSMAQTTSQMGEEFSSMADLLMIPSLTGENVSAEEYTALLSIIYGATFTRELADSKVTFTLVSPKGKQKKTTVSLLELLVLDEDIIIECR